MARRSVKCFRCNERPRERYNGYCAECGNAYQREYRKKRQIDDPAAFERRRRHGQLKHKYGITIDDLERMHRKQKGRCAICRREKKLFVDHDHETGRVRGLLCNTCNFGIGYFHDKPARLVAAANYLMKQGVK